MPFVLTYQANVADRSTESTVIFVLLFSSSTFENNQANNYSNNK